MKRPLEPVSPAALTGWGAFGLLGGWLLHRVAEQVTGVAPLVTWTQPLLLAFIAAILGGTAWITHRQLQGRNARIEAYRAVNRLVLARACQLVGALLAGGYLGYALSWLGLGEDPLADERMVRSVVAAVAGVAILVTARLLEHACQVRDPDGDSA